MGIITKPEAEECLALTVKEVATLLNISRATVSRLMQSRKLQGKRIGNRVVILKRDFDNYVKSLPNAHSEKNSEVA